MTVGPQGGTRKDDDEPATAAPEQSPRAAQGPMSDDVTTVPRSDVDEAAESKSPGMPDATGPTG